MDIVQDEICNWHNDTHAWKFPNEKVQVGVQEWENQEFRNAVSAIWKDSVVANGCFLIFSCHDDVK